MNPSRLERNNGSLLASSQGELSRTRTDWGIAGTVCGVKAYGAGEEGGRWRSGMRSRPRGPQRRCACRPGDRYTYVHVYTCWVWGQAACVYGSYTSHTALPIGSAPPHVASAPPLQWPRQHVSAVAACSRGQFVHWLRTVQGDADRTVETLTLLVRGLPVTSTPS